MSAKSSSNYANFFRDFAPVVADLHLPAAIEAVVMPRHQQSVLRVNQQGMRLWTHYDTLDNVLCQIVGRKRVVVFPPSQYTNLYMEGSSSRVTNIDAPDLDRFPRFAMAMQHAAEFILTPGDMLVIPAMWLHHVTAIDACISVNIFYETLPKALYDPKDMYGNKDLPAAVKARTALVELATKSFLGGALPAPHDEFALRQAIADLEALADQVALSRRP
jgi:tRNA wybutosine-synthesizing protein 4